MAKFVWGGAGSKLTPEEVERQRMIADQLMQQGADYSPVGHWSQGATRVMASLNSGLANRRADKAETSGREAATAAIAGLLGGQGGSAQSAPASAPSAPPVEAGPIRAGLIERGLPEHVADGFVMNFRDESGLNPGINEQNPTVPGSRGGFGLAQWTGPRREALEGFAAERGLPVSDPNVQLDYLMTELQGPEAEARKAIMAAATPGDAAAAIAREFLRPAPEHLQRRVESYTGQRAPANQVAQAGGQPDISALMQAASNPWLSKGQRSVVEALLGRALDASDPKTQLEIRKLQRELQQPPKRDTTTINGRLVDAQTGEQIADFQEPKAPDVESFYDEATGMEYKAKWNPQTQSYERIGGVKAPSGTQLSVDPNTGAVTFQQGAGLKPLTEAQSKDTVFVTRASGALPIIDQHGEALARLGEATGGGLPVVGNYMKSPEYQQAEQAGKEFLQAILRKDTGAAITAEETQEYGSVYLPRPGDSPEVLAQKKASRTRALQAIELGLPPSALLKLEGAGVKLSKDRASDADKPISEMTDEELEAIANGN